MLHARNDFLPDIAAFREIDPVQKVHIRFMRKGVAIGEVDPALRHAGANAQRVVPFAFGAGGNFSRFRQRPKPDGSARIARQRQRFGLRRFDGLRKGDRLDVAAAIMDGHFRTQLVEIETFGEILRERQRAIEKIAPLASGEDKEIEQYLALRRQQRGKARLARSKRRDIVRDKPVQETPCVLACHFHDASVGKRNRFCHIPCRLHPTHIESHAPLAH